MPESGDYTLAENSPCIGSGQEGLNMGALEIGCSSVNLPPTEFSLSSPENNFQLLIEQNNESQSLSFRWENSEDDNGDSLLYYLIFDIEDFLIDTIETRDSEIEIPFSYFIDALTLHNFNSGTILWDVLVSDSIDYVPSSNGPFSLFIDISGILNINKTNIIPDVFALYQNYPNPFNPMTKIVYDLPNDEWVNIAIYDVRGRKIRSLVNQNQNLGRYEIRWDGRNDFGKKVSAGLFVYSIQAGIFHSTKKMVLLK